jgi:predicted transcriptional regulator
MLEPLLGSKSRERVLVFLRARSEGYAREIARFFDTDVAQVQKQLDRLEFAGVLAGRAAGRTRLYMFNPRYPFSKELAALLDKALEFYPEEQRDALLMNRRRPRRRGKPL